MFDTVIIGKCEKCGGIVSRPRVYMSIKRPQATCENCEAIVDETALLPTVLMNNGK